MHLKGYRVTLSQNVKDGISGMRIVRYEDINHQTERQYKPGYKLSEITNKLKIADIKTTLNSNLERAEHIQTLLGQVRESEETEISKACMSSKESVLLLKEYFRFSNIKLSI